jgi:Fe-S-cluster containining protein
MKEVPALPKIVVYYKDAQPEPGINIRINDAEATLADLLQAWQPLCDDKTLFKTYAADNHASCRGCTVNCCNTAYVIPDIIAFKKMADYLQLSYQEFMASRFQADKLAVGLPRMKADPCTFLQDNICAIYPLRSLICRFYICAPLSGPTEQLVYSLAWTGSTATILLLEQQGLLSRRADAGLSSMDMLFQGLMEEYRHKPQAELFLQAREYSDIPLVPFLDQYSAVLLEPSED